MATIVVMLDATSSVALSDRNQFPKICARCGATHDEIAWDRLPVVGIQEADGERIELRNCACGSTLSVELPKLIGAPISGPSASQVRYEVTFSLPAFFVDGYRFTDLTEALDTAQALANRDARPCAVTGRDGAVVTTRHPAIVGELYPSERRIASVDAFRVGARVRRTERAADRLMDAGVSADLVARERAGGVIEDIITSDQHGWTSVAVRLAPSDVYPTPVSWFSPADLEVMP